MPGQKQAAPVYTHTYSHHSKPGSQLLGAMERHCSMHALPFHTRCMRGAFSRSIPEAIQLLLLRGSTIEERIQPTTTQLRMQGC